MKISQYECLALTIRERIYKMIRRAGDERLARAFFIHVEAVKTMLKELLK